MMQREKKEINIKDTHNFV